MDMIKLDGLSNALSNNLDREAPNKIMQMNYDSTSSLEDLESE